MLPYDIETLHLCQETLTFLAKLGILTQVVQWPQFSPETTAWKNYNTPTQQLHKWNCVVPTAHSAQRPKPKLQLKVCDRQCSLHSFLRNWIWTPSQWQVYAGWLLRTLRPHCFNWRAPLGEGVGSLIGTPPSCTPIVTSWTVVKRGHDAIPASNCIKVLECT